MGKTDPSIPGRKFPPHKVEWMLSVVHPKDTICETLRQAFQALDKPAPDIETAKLEIRVAVTMAKRMNKKLKEYKRDYAKDFFEEKNNGS